MFEADGRPGGLARGVAAARAADRAAPAASMTGSSTRRRARRGSRSSARRSACGSRSTTSPCSTRAAACSSELPADAVSTLLSDASHFEGAITVARGPRVARLSDDPFARVFPARILRVEGGLFGRDPAPCGPVIERYGSAQPWPWDRF